jgi:putative DNA methylase
MSQTATDELSGKGLAPFSLKDAPSFIERQFPVGRVSAEAYKERKAGAGQTLTALGSYWKGRKPLILVRAVVLGCLLPATDNPATDLDVFLKLMAMDDAAFGLRFGGGANEFAKLFPEDAESVTEEFGRRRVWRDELSETQLLAQVSEIFSWRTYNYRVKQVRRPEECDEAKLLAQIWDRVNRHLGTNTQSLADLVDQLGVARFGHRPKLADTFCGGGSIPFEAARLGCDVYASDLNPIACMLTWGAFNIIGASEQRRAEIEAEQREMAAAVDAEITRLGVEHDAEGNRAKAYLYCLETRDPRTGWMVPMASSWVISKTRNVIGKLVPDQVAKRYEIEIHSGVSAAEMVEAAQGTVREGRLFHPMSAERSGVEIKTIRGDYRDIEGSTRNRLRPWEKSEFMPRPDDIFQERLYCIQWIAKTSLGKSRQETFFASVTEDDLAREHKVEAIVRENLSRWQDDGLIPDMPIEPGEKTDEPIRTRGWTYWHHLFGARSLLVGSLTGASTGLAVLELQRCKAIDRMTKLCRWNPGHPGKPGVAVTAEKAGETFDNQALNPQFNYAIRSAIEVVSFLDRYETANYPVLVNWEVQTSPAAHADCSADLFITDPPYADAVNYHEITEFFIAWLRKKPPTPFDLWTWDSRRDLAIKGRDEQFRRDMVAAYAAMTRHMPANGLQVVMFTHQDASVWADLAAILWAAGLRVTAAWNIVTETESALKEGNYVQGTVCLVLRKRMDQANARRMEIEAEIEEAVRLQLDRLSALDEAWRGEALYTDGDLTLAAYAAALQVVTSYSTIDRQPLDRDLYRKLARGETTMIRDLVDYAAQVANGLLVPLEFPRDAWRDLDAPERFYVRMLDMEAKGSAKVADFQNFAKSFAFGDYTDLMASTAANAASLAGAADLKGRLLGGVGFGASQTRQVLFATWKSMEKRDPKVGLAALRTEYPSDYWRRRQKLIGLADYIAAKTRYTRPDESEAAHELAEAMRLDRV